MADSASGKNKVFVAGLPWETNQNELYELVKPCGSIVEAKIILDRATGKSKGFAFVEMATEAEAKAVIARVNGAELGGRTLFASEFKASAKEREQPPGTRPAGSPRAFTGPPGGVERRSGQDRRKNPGFGGPKAERREFAKPWEKKPWQDRKPGGFGDKKPWEKKPWDKDRKPGFGDKKPWEKKPWDKDKKPGGFGGKKPFGRKPFGKKPGGFRKPGPPRG